MSLGAIIGSQTHITAAGVKIFVQDHMGRIPEAQDRGTVFCVMLGSFQHGRGTDTAAHYNRPGIRGQQCESIAQRTHDIHQIAHRQHGHGFCTGTAYFKYQTQGTLFAVHFTDGNGPAQGMACHPDMYELSGMALGSNIRAGNDIVEYIPGNGVP